MRISRKSSAIVAALGAVVAACLLLPRPAAASSDMETVLQDEPKIVFQDDASKLDNTLRAVAFLGVDTIRVSLYWHLVAPNPTSRRRPHLGSGGDGYLSGPDSWRWGRYDTIVKLAARNGLNVYLSPTGPAPRWATRGHGHQINNTWPSATEYYKFVRAAGIRYSGSYPDPARA